jgi:predicted SAM-dependent methyltransferase
MVMAARTSRVGCGGSSPPRPEAKDRCRREGQGVGTPSGPAADRGLRVNVGCGATPTLGWLNFDNSLAVRAANWPLAMQALRHARILNGHSWEFVQVSKRENIRFANATIRIPCPDSSAEVVYSSHMIEHLDRREAQAFLGEARRILRPGGVVRIAAPDLARFVESYSTTGDADEFIASTHMGLARPVGVLSRAKWALVGPRHHLWMYDGVSLSKLISDAGFVDVMIMPAGKTSITDPGSLDLEERADESVYVEAVRPE